jgi:hypothetical protein
MFPCHLAVEALPAAAAHSLLTRLRQAVSVGGAAGTAEEGSLGQDMPWGGTMPAQGAGERVRMERGRQLAPEEFTGV